MTSKSIHLAKQPTLNLNAKAVKSLADAIYKHLQDEGCQTNDIINVSSQLLGLVTEQISDVNPAEQ